MLPGSERPAPLEVLIARSLAPLWNPFQLYGGDKELDLVGLKNWLLRHLVPFTLSR
jgi:hypothetical protein